MDEQFSNLSEEELRGLLAALRREPTPESDFEARFLCDFRESVAREAVCCPARRHLLVHVHQAIANIGRWRLAYGASALGVGLLAVGFFSSSWSERGASAKAAVASRFRSVEASLAEMKPSLSRDIQPFTTIKLASSPRNLYEGMVLVQQEENTTDDYRYAPSEPLYSSSSKENFFSPGLYDVMAPTYRAF